VEAITLCRMVDRMEEAGMIERRRDPADRRAWQLYLTARTREMIDEVRACIDSLLEDMLAGISPAERAEFARLLTLIGTNLGARRDNKVPVNG
jgi:DNA-binding MarR family transcriptional regulator